MNEIPITLEASNSQLLMECSIETEDSEDAVQDINSDLSVLANDASMPIAIVGMGFRGPGDATNVERLWEALLEQREEWSRIPGKRWNSSAFYHPDHSRHGTINVEGGHFLEEDISIFDAPFFNMSSDEAAAMDPQQRLLLEVVYEGLENAGLSLHQVAGSKTSCFVGSFCADYTDLLLRDPETVPMYQCTNSGQSRAMTSNRISYFYDFKGPSVTVDTACSGSLVALHLACQSLQTGDATMAIAAGVNLILSHEFMSTMSMMRFLSPDGRCHTFDEKANGYSRGEAIGCVILKPLDHALRDGNAIRAIIRGTGSNQDGRTPGITLPSGVAQESLIRDVYDKSGLCPSETDVVEAHGTGTQAGDPLETSAISRVLGPGHSTESPVFIGSIKTNVGHLEGTSGVAGVIKAVLMLENRTILPSRNFETPNPRIPLEDWSLRVPCYPEPWNHPGPHRVSVNSFGYGGSNAHAILEETSGYLSHRGLEKWHRKPSKASWRDGTVNYISLTPPRQRIFLLSGFDEYSCKANAKSLREYILRHESIFDSDLLDDVAFTLSECRSRFMWKTAVTGKSAQDLVESLSSDIKPRISLKRPTLAFIFTGQGAQWSGMGKELLEAYSVFHDSISQIDGYLAEMGASFKVYDEISKRPQDSQLNRPLLSQTVCTALQIALIDLLMSWSIYPDSVTGHSSGEIAAAYASGALNKEDAIKVAYYRGISADRILAMDEIKGSMVAVGMSSEAIEPYVGSLVSGKADVACINSPTSVTVSGDAAAITELAEKLEGKSVFLRRLSVEVAYHSHHMELVADEYLSAIADICPRSQPTIAETCQPLAAPFFSSVTGESLRKDDLGPQYWVSNLLGQVKFSESLQTLCFETNSWHQRTELLNGRKGKGMGSAKKASVDCLLEIGPHSALSGPVKQILQSHIKLNTAEISYLSMLERGKDAGKSALRAVSALASMNYPLDLTEINKAKENAGKREPRLLVDMPAYCWNHTRSYWAEPRLSKTFRNRSHPRTDLLGMPDNIACPFEPRWRNFIRFSEIPWIADHKIQSDIVFPAAGYLCMAIEAATQISQNSQDVVGLTIRDVSIHSALVITEAKDIEVLTSLRALEDSSRQDSEDWYRFRIYSVSKDNRWTEHCSGDIKVELQAHNEGDVNIPYLENANIHPLSSKAQNIRVVDVDRLYDRLQKVGLEYGPYFANLTCAHGTEAGICFAEVKIPNTAAAMPMNFEYGHIIHPCTLDSIFHAIFAALPDEMAIEKGPIIPISLGYMHLSCPLTSSPGDMLSICTDVRQRPGGQIVASILVAEKESQMGNLSPRISISGFRGMRLELAANISERRSEIPIAYSVEWRADPVFVTHNDASLSRINSDVHQDKADSLAEYDYYVTVLIQSALETFREEHSQKPDLIYDKYGTCLAEMIRVHAAENQSIDEIILTNNTSSSPMGRLITTIDAYLSSLSQIEEESFIQIHEELSSAYQEVLSTDDTYISALEYLRLVGFKKPDMSILQLGGGTGRPLTIFLEMLLADMRNEENDSPPFSKYTFTYRDEDEYERVRLYLERWSPSIDIVKLDDGRNVSGISTLGSNNYSYDVIIAPHGFHSFSSNLDALKLCHSMLKPSGHLIVVDPLRPKESILDNFLAAALYLWPMGNFELPNGLKDEGNNLDKIIALSRLSPRLDATTDQHSQRMENLIICQPQNDTEVTDQNFLIIKGNDSDMAAAEYLRCHLSEISPNVEISCLADADPRTNFCVVLNEKGTNILPEPDSKTLERIKEILLYSTGVLWITCGSDIETISPEYGLDIGISRSARSESAVSPILTLNLDAQNPLSHQSFAELTVKLLRMCLSQVNFGEIDTEYVEKNGVIMIPRVVERPDLGRELNHINDREIQCEQHFREKDKPLRVSRFNGFGMDPHLMPDVELSSPPPTGYVRIEVIAFGLSEADIQDSSEELKMSGTLGLECSGRVIEIGAGVHSLSVGDRVACLGAGTARSYYQDRESAFQRIGDSMAYEMAAALPVAYTTAYFILHYLTRARSDDLVLIQDAASLLGQALLEICCIREAGMLATVNDLAQKEFLLSRFAIPPERIFIEGADNILKNVLEMTCGKKARVVIATANRREKIHHDLVKSVSSFGHFIYILRNGDDDKTRNEIPPAAKNITFSSLNIFDFQKDRADMTRHIWNKVILLFNEGKLHGPSSLSVYKITDLDQALGSISSNKHVVVSARDNEMIQMTRPNIPKNIFRRDASYLLVGGLGGIGRSIALWMADRGAKNLILLNKSGLAKPSAQATVQELSNKGVQIDIHACDISNESEVKQMFLDISWGAPPVRGIVHGAMVLKDIHIEKMTVEDYLEVLRPRYNGTWNLHRYAPTDLDFFLMLSSISGVIGNATQAAYAAGSAFMDSFASYRNTLGLPATSLDLGVITDVGYLAANEELASRMARQGFQGMNVQTLLSLVEIAIEQQQQQQPLQLLHSRRSQIITGLGEWKEGQSLGNFDAPLFAHFRRKFRTDGIGRAGDDDDSKIVFEAIRDALKASKTQDDAISIVFEALSAKIASQLGISVERIDPASPLSEFGVDSHVAVELRSWINKTIDSPVSILEILASESVLHLASHIASRSVLVENQGDM